MATTEKAKPAGPFKLVTVNSSPDRAKKLCGRLVEEMRATHHIDYVANTTSIDGVRAMVEEHKPNLMFTASMWTPEEAAQAVSVAREIVPDIKVMSLPKGLQVEKGPEGVIEYGKAHLPAILDS
ncbi:hypothetical protein INS49_000365 [Diaporthe citri]|uniref:uncharacterized protein n=1 Tax=Diaporthe citri TaxID=83186 RepID=UPI001C81F1FC|nr:uncharacterized protein INS49_000365 [Diaporthe citri]KAG6366189.1 hypothetical protein INS49_000365 [Diaporthe citri]